MSSTLLVLVNKVARRLGGTEFTIGEVNATTRNVEVQQLIDEINAVQLEVSRMYDWSVLQGSTSGITASSSISTLVLSGISSLDFMRPLNRVKDTTTPRILRECSRKEWESRTYRNRSGTPEVYRRLGTEVNGSGTHFLKIEFDPAPDTSPKTYTFDYQKLLSELNTASATSPFPDDVLVNGALAKHAEYEGFDPTRYQAAYDNAVERLIAQEDDAVSTNFGGGGVSSFDPTHGGIFPAGWDIEGNE